MDEAEYLGDRIALLSHGKIICYGTPNYLKEQYGKPTPIRQKPTKVPLKIIRNLIGQTRDTT